MDSLPVMYEVILHFADYDDTTKLPAGGIPRIGESLSWTLPNAYSEEYRVTDIHWTLDSETGTSRSVHLTLDPKD